jgi:PKD repeat protein/ribosomal protein L40E
MMEEPSGKPDRCHRAVLFWLIAGLVFLCIVPVCDAAPNTDFQVAQIADNYIAERALIAMRCADSPTVDVMVTSPLVKPGVVTTITFIVTNKSGVPVSSANVSVTTTGGMISAKTGKTNAAGRFPLTFSSDQIGTFSVSASASTTGTGTCAGGANTLITVDSTAPAAQIAATPFSPSGPAPLKVTFDGSGSSGADGATIAAYAWKFSDGGTASGRIAEHTYSSDGTFTVTLEVTDNHGKKSLPETETYIVSPKTILAVVVAPGATAVVENGTIEIAIIVKTKDGNPVPNASVTLNSTAEGTVSPLTNTTDHTGTVLFRFHGVTEGNATITALAESPVYIGSVQKLTIRVTPAATGTDLLVPLEAIVALVLILVIVALVLLYLWTRSRFILKPKVKEVPADGRSSIPIRVQFANGFGRLKKQHSDREIHLEATAGRIQDVVIPAGREYVDATLTASKECGLVLVTATTEDKAKATAEVRFTGDEAAIDVEITPAEIPADGTSTATIILRVRDRNGTYLTYLDEKVIGLTTTLGTVPATVRVEPRAASGTAMIVSGDKTGTALVRARTGSVAGEARVQFKELGKRYCMHCGVQMEMEAPSCPNCGRIPPSGVDTKQCSTCNAVLPQPAVFCDKCGARQPQ